MAQSLAYRWVHRLALGIAAGALTALAGCVAVPVDGYAVGDPVAYPVYGNYPAYYGVPAYYGPWYWGAPAVSLGFYGRFGGGHHGSGWDRGAWRGGGHWAPGGRGGHGSWSGRGGWGGRGGIDRGGGWRGR